MSKILFGKTISQTANNAISFLGMIAISTVSKRSSSLTELITQLSNGPYLFIPYESPDCLALHIGLSKSLQTKGFASSHEQKIPSFDPGKYIKNSATPRTFSQLQSSLHNHLREANLEDLYYPVLDTIIYTIPHNLFQEGIEISPSFFIALGNHYHHLEKICQNFQSCFLADSGYINNQAIKQIMLKSGKTVFYLNPRGQLRRYTSINYSECSVCQDMISISASEEKETNKYLAKRFSGKSKRDLETSSSFRQSQPTNASNKKVLYLHCFRDANNTTWKTGQAFDSYYEWVDYTLSVISKANLFDQWYIKPHPSRHHYESDDNILDQLLYKHNVPGACLKNIPATREILAKRMPIYTNNGTIILEGACQGQAVYFCGSNYIPSLGHYASSKNQWANMLLQPKLISDSIETDIAKVARYSLWDFFESRNISWLCPNRPIMPRETSLNKIKVLLSQICNSSINMPCAIDVPIIGPPLEYFGDKQL